jgi:antitoxin ParD1/3/4
VRSSKPLTVTLGPLQHRVDERVASGEYGSASEVIRAALRALDREDAALDAVLKQRVEASLADPRPSLTLDDAFAQVRARHAERLGRDDEKA